MMDVAIIGGGPAGSAAAIALARAGRSVALIERTQYDTVRIGETVPPKLRVLLGRLGALKQFENAGHVSAPGIVSAWGNAAPHANDFIVNPYGNGWHLDRQRFDRMLSSQAGAAGAFVHEQTAVTGCEHDDAGWRLAVQGTTGPNTLVCRFIIDASGRRASPLKRRAGQRRIHDRLVGIAAFMPNPSDADTRTLIESTVDGWWYSTALPDNGRVAVLMTDADTLNGTRRDLAGLMRRQLCAAPLSHKRIGAIGSDARILPFAAMTYDYPQIQGGNWLLAGDAAATWDPLSGYGICKALESGMRAACAIDRALAGDNGELASYAQWMRTQFVDYLQARSKYYRAEQRWPDAPFWRRRHAVN